MQFDVIIGNPPYQLGAERRRGLGSFAMPIYQKFVQAAKALGSAVHRHGDPVTLVRRRSRPRRVPAGDAELTGAFASLVDFPESREVFAGVDIAGGVSYFLWDSSWDGECEVTTVVGGVAGPTMSRYLDEYDILVRRQRGGRDPASGPQTIRPDGRVQESRRIVLRQSSRSAFEPTSGARRRAGGMTDPVMLSSEVAEPHSSSGARSRGTRMGRPVEGDRRPSRASRRAIGQARGSTRLIWHSRAAAWHGMHRDIPCCRIDSTPRPKRQRTSLGTCGRSSCGSLSLSHEHAGPLQRALRVRARTCRWTPLGRTRTCTRKYGLTAEEIAFIETTMRPMEADA